jgi:hypothetical protein
MPAGPAHAALQAAIEGIAALQLAHRTQKEAGLPTKVLHDRACRDRDLAVAKLSRTQGELEDTQAQLEALLKKQETLQARAKEQAAKVSAAAQKVQDLGHRMALEAAAAPGSAPANSPFVAAAPGQAFASTGASPFKRSRPDEPVEEVDADMGRRAAPSLPTSPLAAGLVAALGGAEGPPQADLLAAAAAGHTNF